MQARTHAVGGLLATCGTIALFGPVPPFDVFLVVVGGMVGSLLPDMDHPESAFGRRAVFVSDVVSVVMGHRGGMHSLLLAVVWGVAVWCAAVFIFSWRTALLLSASVFGGYLSHLFLDTLNPSGVPLFWPFWKRKVGVPLAHTAGPVEQWVIFPVLFVLFVLAAGWTCSLNYPEWWTVLRGNEIVSTLKQICLQILQVIRIVAQLF